MADIEMLSSNEPELPLLPPPPPTSTRPSTRLRKKRTIDQVLYNASSDPPLFSSDDASSTIENYTAPRRKRLHGGTWWSSQEIIVAGESTVKREFTRNYDSGIWMGSESSIADTESVLDLQDIVVVAQDCPETRRENKILKIADLPALATEEEGIDLTPDQFYALQIIEGAVNNNNPTIDLTDFDLQHLPWRILKPLQTLIPEPRQKFQPLLSNLRLYLARNSLDSLPEELFMLKGVSLLSLRNNNLQEISPAIANLAPSITELNLSVNELHYLPAEIRGLVHDCPNLVLRLSNNPFFTPVPPASVTDTATGQADLPENKEDNPLQDTESAISHLSRITYLSLTGLPLNGIAPSTSTSSPPLTTSTSVLPPSNSRIPSLYELALRSSTCYPLQTLLPILGTAPDSMLSNLRRAAKQAKSGFQACAICGRKFSVARTEWIEWQRSLAGYADVPLLMRGCSWGCVPDGSRVEVGRRDCGWVVGEGSGLRGSMSAL